MTKLILAALTTLLAFSQIPSSMLRQSSAVIASPARIKLYGVDTAGNVFPITLAPRVKVVFKGNSAVVDNATAPLDETIVPDVEEGNGEWVAAYGCTVVGYWKATNE